MAKWNHRQKYNIEKEAVEAKSKFKFSKLARRQAMISAFSVAAVFVVILGSTYAIFSSVNKSKDYNTLNVGTLEITYDDTSSGLGNIINLNGAYPISDSDGLAQSPYTFRVKNNGSLDASYKISIVDDTNMISADGCSSNLLNKANIKVSIDGGTPFLLSSKASGSYVIGQGILSAGKSKNHQIRMWIDINSGNEVLGKHYHGKILIQSSSDVLPTDESCFEFDSSTGTITKFICGPYVYNLTSYVAEVNTNSVNNITDVVIPKTIGGVAVTKIGPNAFNGNKITSVVIPESTVTIENGSFAENKLTDVEIPEGVESIGVGSFRSNQIENVVFPETLKTLGYNSFGFNQLVQVTVPAGITSIDTQSFYKTSTSNPYLSLIINKTGKSFDWKSITGGSASATFAAGNVTHSQGNIVVSNGTPISESCFDFNSSTGTITKFICAPNISTSSSVPGSTQNTNSVNNITNVVIPTTINGVPVTKIENFAFYNNQLTSVVIPSTITEIGMGAFYSNRLASLFIPSSVASIGVSAFNDNQLSDAYAFVYKRNSDGSEDKTTIVSYGGAKRSGVVIPNGVTTISAQAFYNNQLTSVTISNSVTNIEVNAFQRNKLANITIPSSVIKIGGGAFADNQLTSVVIKGKANKNAFTSYPSSSPFGWATGYSDSNITWNG